MQQLPASTACVRVLGVPVHVRRFDVRALLDFYKEPDPRVLAARQKTHEELKLEEVRSSGVWSLLLLSLAAAGICGQWY